MLEKIENRTYHFINKLQNYFKIDLFYLIKGEFWLMMGKIISITITFLLALAWANWIDKDVYGNYQYILSFVGIISIFSLPGMGTAIVQAVARNLEGSFVRGFKTQLKWGLLGSLSSLGIAGYYWFQGNSNIAIGFLIIAIFLPLFQAAQLYTSFLEGKRLFDIQVKYSTTFQLIATSIMILTLFVVNKFFLELSIGLILLLIIFISFSSKTILYTFFWFKTKNKFQPNTKEDTRTINFGKHLTFAEAISTLAENLDKILLFHYLGAVELAVYAFATLVPQQINVILKHISTLALPKFSVRSRKEIRETLLKKIGYLTLLISSIVFIYIITAPLLYQVFFPKYLNSIPYSRLYALSIIPLCFSMGSVFGAKMMTKEIYQLKIIVPIFKIILLVILVPLYGIWGAILSILFTRIFGGLLSLLFFRRI